MITRPQFYKVYSSYCFGAKQSFGLGTRYILKTESSWIRPVLCSFSNEQVWPNRPQPTGMNSVLLKTSSPSFWHLCCLLKEQYLKLRLFWLLSPIAHPFCDCEQLAGFAVWLRCGLGAAGRHGFGGSCLSPHAGRSSTAGGRRSCILPSVARVVSVRNSSRGMERSCKGPMGDSRVQCKGLMSGKLKQTFWHEL